MVAGVVEGKARVDGGLPVPKERAEGGLARDTGEEANAGAAVEEVPNKAGAAKGVVVPVEVKKEGAVIGVAVDDVVLGAYVVFVAGDDVGV